MRLVVDANVVFAAVIKKSYTLDLIHLLSKKGFILCSPAYLLEETNQRINTLLRFSGLNKVELKFLLQVILKKIEVVPEQNYRKYLKKAQALFPEHLKDAPYFALALSLDCGIWSNEKRFKQQSLASVLTTSELMKLTGSK